ncbi:MAG: C25 family cysteine peptidase, partial [Chloroflexota bacterium]
MTTFRPDENYSGDNGLWAGHGYVHMYPDCCNTNRGLLEFDLRGLPLGISVTGATLRATIATGNGTAREDYAIRRLEADWETRGVTWNNQPSSAGPYATTAISALSGTVSWDVTDLVREWLAGTYPNYGLHIRRKNDTAATTNHDRLLQDPQLDITYEVLPIYDLLIISPAEYESALQPLVDHKNATGIRSAFLTLEDARSRYPGVDDPEKVKRAIADYHRSHQVRYVMLMGDSDKFPVRFTLKCESDAACPYLHSYRSSDLYYADLYERDGLTFETWDGNGDGQYGEQGCDLYEHGNVDSLDMIPEVSVGRVPVSTLYDVNLYVAKVLDYELLSAGRAFGRRALGISGNYAGASANIDELAAALPSLSVTKLKHDDPGCDPGEITKPDNINLELMQGALFTYYVGHGAPTSWSVGSGDSSCPGTPSTYYAVPNDMYWLNNDTALPVWLSVGCETGSFTSPPPWNHPYIDVNGVRRDYSGHSGDPRLEPERPAPLQTGADIESWAEYLLVKDADGGIAYVAPVITNISGEAVALLEQVFRAYESGSSILGDVWLTAYRAWVPMENLNDAWMFKNREIYQLFGDQSLRIGGVPRLELSGSPSPASPGQEVDYLVEGAVTLPGPGTARVQVVIPSRATFVSATEGGEFDGDRTVTWVREP